MQNVQGVIFDLGGVLIDWNPMYLYRKVFADEAAASDFLARICTREWNEQQDAGRPLREATEDLARLHPEREYEIRAFYGRWKEMLGGIIPGTVEVIGDLKAAGIRVFALTNWSHETFPVARELFPELALFEQVVVSGEHRCAKPDPKLYRIAIEAFGLPASALAFVDDSPRNVAAAEAAGIRSLLFTDSTMLRRDLKALGLPL
ncbi:MAG TPA: HAD family phosphatase [Rhizomicrobium sp.]|nr:HAD family phosphatase [Rhizomicrobium sp.]